MKKLFFVALALACAQVAAAQYSVSLIPESLVKGSDAVVRSHITEYIYSSPVSASEKISAAITVMNEDGEDAAGILFATDAHSSLKSFSGEIFDHTGKSLRKIKKSDLTYSEYMPAGYISDMRQWGYFPKVAGYPYTVVYEYEITHKDGILAFPTFAPVDSYDMSVEKAEYRLTVPAGTKFYVKTLNSDIEPVTGQTKNGETYVWRITDFAPVSYSPFAPPYNEVFPMVYVVPHDFTYNKKSGTMDSWGGYSRWQWALLENRDILPEEAKAKVRELTADAAGDREKIEKLYEYLGQTRYVLIALGVGGFQPMSAADVYKNKFGDCKGLSNYMMAMLAECGIKSYYTEIGSGSRKLRDDYVHPIQTNHAILYVPLDDEELWIECTAPTLPLGYVHSSISDRKALVYRNGTAELVDMPSYPDSAHLSAMVSEFDISIFGKIDGKVKMTNNMGAYEELMSFNKLSAAEKLKFVGRDVELPLAEITNITYEEEKSSAPWASIGYDIKGQVNISGNRGYISACPFRRYYVPQLRRSRTLDIYVRSGYRKTDSVVITLPDGYRVEALPPPVNIENAFGHYSMLVLPGKGKVTVHRELQMNKGVYPSGDYAEFKEFIDKISAGNGSRIVIVKE